jgi:hypothetical protein
MSDLLIDPATGDIKIVNNAPILETDEATLVRQRLTIRLNTFLGEWFYNLEVGVPYFEQILTQQYQRFLVENILRDVILKTEGVVRITNFEGTFNPRERVYNATFTVTTLNQNVVTVTI